VKDRMRRKSTIFFISQTLVYIAKITKSAMDRFKINA